MVAMLQLYNVPSMHQCKLDTQGLSIKAVHLDKEVRFLLSDHLDLIREHLSLT